MVWGWSRGSFIVVPTGADVAGTCSILSLILSRCLLPRSLHLHFCFLIPSLPVLFFPAATRWRDPPVQTFSHSGSQCSESCDPARYLLVSLRPRALALSQCPFPPLTKPDKGLSFLLACLLSVCLYCTKLGSLSHCIPSFSLQRRCLGAPGPLALWRGPASARWGRRRRGCWWEGLVRWVTEWGGRRKSKSERVYYFIKCFGARQGLGS